MRNRAVYLLLVLFLWANTSLALLAEPGQSLNDFADLVCPLPTTKPEKFSMPNNPDIVGFVDPSRELKAMGTDFVVAEFFSTPDRLYNFLKLVYSSVSGNINMYRENNNLSEKAIFFIFKGGNVLRMVANQFLSLVPEGPEKLIRENYGNYFKRSDADFSIFVNADLLPQNLAYQQVMDDMNQLAYEALNQIRDEFNSNPNKYFDFLGLDLDVASKKLSNVFVDLGDLESAKDPKNKNWYEAKFIQLGLLNVLANPTPECEYQGNYDFKFEFGSKEKRSIQAIPLAGDKQQWIVNTINRALEWPFGTIAGAMVRFDLVRSKIQFEYTFKIGGKLKRKSVGGELIDISIPYKEDPRIPEFVNKFDDYVQKYTINLENNNSFDLLAESFLGLAEDLLGVVFKQNNRPWNDVKYAKRINRTFLLQIIEIAGNFGWGSEQAQEYVKFIDENLVVLLEKFYNLDEENKKLLVDSLEQYINKIPVELAIAIETWEAIGNLIKTGLLENPEAEDQEKFGDFINTLKANIDLMKSLNYGENFKIDSEEIYKVNMNSLF